jgi:hypothetical protein
MTAVVPEPPSIAVVIATNRQESINRWFDAWRYTLKDHAIYVVEDNPKKSFTLRSEGWDNVAHDSWAQIDADLGKDSWIIPRRTSAIKSYGFLRAFRDGHDIIWTLDDDCFPESETYWGTGYPTTLRDIYAQEILNRDWWNTISKHGLYPRGYPYGIRQETSPVMVHHGLWSGVPDLDGITALEHHGLLLDEARGTEVIPKGRMFPMCGMNLSFHRDMTPAMYFGLQGAFFPKGLAGTQPTPLPFDRFDDIWAGLFAKRVLDQMNWAVTSGAPSIVHTKESDPTMRVIKEGPGIAVNEKLWRWVANAQINGRTPGSAYRNLAVSLVDFAKHDDDRKDYWALLSRAMRTWTEICR